jgi:hypothetical protein
MNKFAGLCGISTLASLLIVTPLNAEGVIRTRTSFGNISSVSLSTSANQIYGTGFFLEWNNLNQIERNDAASDVIGWIELRFRNFHRFDRNGSINAEVVKMLSSGSLVPVSGRCNIKRVVDVRAITTVTCNLKSPKGQIVLRGKTDS